MSCFGFKGVNSHALCNSFPSHWRSPPWCGCLIAYQTNPTVLICINHNLSVPCQLQVDTPFAIAHLGLCRLIQYPGPNSSVQQYLLQPVTHLEVSLWGDCVLFVFCLVSYSGLVWCCNMYALPKAVLFVAQHLMAYYSSCTAPWCGASVMGVAALLSCLYTVDQ